MSISKGQIPCCQCVEIFIKACSTISDIFPQKLCQFKLSLAVYENAHLTTPSPTLNVIFKKNFSSLVDENGVLF